jgi:hypothetical protein
MSNLASTAQFASNVFSMSTDGDGLTARESGTLILSMLSPRIFQKIFKKFKPCNSFYGDTLVDTEFGLRLILDIQIGDKVWAFNEETGKSSLQSVVHLISDKGEKRIARLTLDNGEEINATSGHPFYSLDGAGNWKWTDAGDLTEGSVLTKKDGTLVNLDSIELLTETKPVFNITVNNIHTYYVGKGRILNHNSGVCNLPIGSVSKGKNFKDHFVRHKSLLSSLTGKNYRKLKTHGQEFVDDIQKLVNNGTFKYAGKGTLKKGQDAMHIYRGEGVTLIVKNSNEFVTMLKSGKGLDISILMGKK